VVRLDVLDFSIKYIKKWSVDMDKNTEIIKSKVKSSVVQLIIAICGAFVAVFGLWMFNQHLLMSFSLPIRMILMIITQWLLFLVPGILMIVNKESLGDIGFRKEKILLQIGIGVLLAFAMSLVLTVFPIMLGLKEMVGNTTYTQTWKFVYQFIYAIFGVALAEELIFRGYIFNKLLKIKNSKWFAIIISSLLFGLFHIFNENIIQVFMTAFLGFLFCIFREKIKGCTLLSLIIAHGVYDAMIVLWVSIL
jgi:membrane protease YdiL (CAAX protease family)